MTNNSLIPYQEVEQFGKAMVASNYFSDAKSISQAVVKIQAGAELGLPPFASMTGIHIIKGKPVLGANVLATLIKNDPRYDYRVKKMADDEVIVSFFEGGQLVGESSFSIEDAKKAGTQNTAKFPRNMLFARAISNGAKWYTPGIFGGMPVYTPEDFNLQVDESGDIVDGQVVVKEGGAGDNGVFSDVVQEIIDEPKAEVKETKGHDMTPPSAETVAMWRGKVESQHRLKMITLAGMVSNAVPYFDGDWHVMNYTEFEKDSVFMENEVALAEFDRLVAIGAAGGKLPNEPEAPHHSDR